MFFTAWIGASLTARKDIVRILYSVLQLLWQVGLHTQNSPSSEAESDDGITNTVARPREVRAPNPDV